MQRREFLEKMGLGTASLAVKSPLKNWKPTIPTFGKSDMLIKFKKGAIVSLKKKNDAYDTDYILDKQRFGDLIIRYRYGQENWLKLSTKEKAKSGQISVKKKLESGHYQVDIQNQDLMLQLDYELVHKQLIWSIKLRNKKNIPIEIGDVAIPFPMNSEWSWKRKITYNQRVIRHSFISGNNSFIFWMRCNAVGPYLLMTPIGDTHLEYYDQSTPNPHGRSIYTAYIHSLVQKEYIRKIGSNWRQEQTGFTLQPSGNKGAAWQSGFRFQWVKDYDEIRQQLFKHDLYNIFVTPGMTVASGMKVQLGFEGKNKIRKVDPEFNNETVLSTLKSGKNNMTRYNVVFKKLGENKVTVHYGQNRTFVLEFFVTESIETLINKRSKFKVDRLQIRDKSKWYNGVFTDWNMKDQVLLSPDNLYTIPESRRYMVTCDDPGLGRPALLAAKNVEYPVQKEIDAMDYYIRNFVWGGLQMTEQESYPYAIYGIPDWMRNRKSDYIGRRGKSHIWRIYDYPHIVLMYLSMFRIAKYHSGFKMQYSWQEYLERAYRTATAYYTYPKEVVGWSPYKTGNYNEIAINELIDELEMAGLKVKALRLRKQWEKKAAYFLSGKANMFGSEYPYDTTGFESTQAFARYAVEHAGKGNNKHMPLHVSQDDAQSFMNKQILLNIGCRGWLEKAYYNYGSDYRAGGNDKYTLSYMAQMGGWSIMDYVLHYADDPYRYLRVGYASILSSWALMNTGTPESDYGFWYPGKMNDGGAGGGFEPLAHTETWLEQPQKRGSWYYSSEIDLGYCGYLRAACTVLADDPVFGLTAYGGDLNENGKNSHVIPNDGVRRRFHVLKNKQRIHLELQYDRFAKNTSIIVSDNLQNISFKLENVDRVDHKSRMLVSGLKEGKYKVMIDGRSLMVFEYNSSERQQVNIPVTKSIHEIKLQMI
ncbi:MAG TPA: DUF5695 domain-containing protein [Balneolales bacterium]|nr:DUF5695 domain-containing protein [Balneolales bacterium]